MTSPIKLENDENLRSKDISSPPIFIINGITFTNRELDICACILSGRSAKKIASFLLISSKTVECHIRNIMIKIGCRSQESIIDFIEKSGKLNFFKKHYSDLLMASNFNSDLKRISILLAQENTHKHCLLFYKKKQNVDSNYMNKIESHLKLAGHQISTHYFEEVKTVLSMIKKIEAQNSKFTHIVLELPCSFFEQLYCKNSTEIKELSILENYAKKISKTIILLVTASDIQQKLTSSLPSNLKDIIFVTMKPNDYYSFAFQILQKVSPRIEIHNIISEFRKISGIPDGSARHSLSQQYKAVRSKWPFERLIFSNARKLILSQFLILMLGSVIYFCMDYSIFSKKSSSQSIEAQSSESSNMTLYSQLKNGKGTTWNIPRHDQIFVGRDNLLKTLHTKLLASSKDSGPNKEKQVQLSVVACSGLGGVGKTQLALQYIHHTLNTYTLKAWFPADNVYQLQQKYLEFSKILGYTSTRVNIEESIAYIKKWLQDHPGWLLIFDNVEQYEDIVPFLPDSGGTVLITTRNTRWPNKIDILPIDIMEPKEAIELVQKLSGRNDMEIETLVSVLGRLPLALAQASAYIREKNKTVAQYLEFYKYYEQKLLSDETLPAGSNHAPVTVTWDSNISAIEQELKKKDKPPLAKALLTTCAYLASEEIPINLLHIWLQKAHPSIEAPELLLDELLRQLLQYSLITVNSEKQTISLHRLLQSVLRHQDEIYRNSSSLDNKPNFSQDWFCDISKALDQGFWSKNTSEKIKIQQLAILPHIQTFENYYNKIIVKSNKKTLSALSRLLSDIGYAFQYILGESALAKSYYERALVLDEQQYGKDHVEVANTLTNLGYAYRGLGDAKYAMGLLERALAIKEKYYGFNHFEVVSTLTILGGSYRDLGNPGYSKKLLERAILIIEKIHDNDNVNIDNMLTNLSSANRSINGTDDPKNFSEDSLDIEHGKNVIEEADTLTYLGSACRAHGNISEAKDFLENALKMRKKYYGMDHFSTALTLTYLGNVYRDLGDSHRARDLLEQALAIREKHYGKNHFEVAITKTYLAMVYRLLGDPLRSKELSEEALLIKEQHYGKDHYEVSITLNILATAVRILGDANRSRELLERALMIRENFYGKNNYETAITLNHLGAAYYELGNLEHAKHLFERTLMIRELHYGKNGHEVSITLTFLGNVYAKLGELNQAKEILERALAIKEKYYGKDHFQTAMTLNNLGNIYHLLNNDKLAKQVLERAISINEAYYGSEQHFELSTSFSYLAEVYKSMNNNKEAENCKKRIAKICEANPNIHLRVCAKQ